MDKLSVRIINEEGEHVETLYFDDYNEMIKSIAEFDVKLLCQDVIGFTLKESFEIYLQ